MGSCPMDCLYLATAGDLDYTMMVISYLQETFFRCNPNHNPTSVMRFSTRVYQPARTVGLFVSLHAHIADYEQH